MTQKVTICPDCGYETENPHPKTGWCKACQLECDDWVPNLEDYTPYEIEEYNREMGRFLND